MKPDQAALSEAVEAAVRQAEARTDAEIVVVIAGRSGSYRDIALGVGAVVAWALLLVSMWSPVNFSALALALELPLAFGGATWAAHRSPALMRRLCSPARRRAQVQSAANAAFHEEGVHATRGRTGLLVYWSRLEREVALVPDQGLAGCVPEAAWAQIRWEDGAGQVALVEGLGALGALLAAAIPATADNPNERPDAPRVRA